MELVDRLFFQTKINCGSDCAEWTGGTVQNGWLGAHVRGIQTSGPLHCFVDVLKGWRSDKVASAYCFISGVNSESRADFYSH